MTWIVRVALERPLTFIVMAILIVIAGPLAAMNMPTDIFPDIKIPVIGVAFQYTDLSPDEMAGRVISQFERGLTTTVNDIEHIESTSLPGMGIEKIYFQPGVDIAVANAQVTAISQTTIKSMPQGMNPPLILNYNASTVPILQLAFSGDHMSEAQILDLAQNFVRPVLTTIPGAAIPYSYGGKLRQLQIDLDSQALQARGLSAQDVGNAIAAQNQIIPVGDVKLGARQYTVKLNDAAETIEDLNNIPIKTVNGATVYIRDVGHVRDGSPPQRSMVHVDGVRAVLTTILKNGSASTLDIVQGVKDALPKLQATLPDNFKIHLLNDQSIFVKAAVSGVMREGIIAAALTSLMILIFLGSWRSTVIIAISIPLAVFAAIAALWLNGETLNLMTLGGLALAVGILVDDATVTIENINWHLEHGKDVRTAILDGAQQIVQPAFVSLLCICIVFVPMFALKGVAGFLFVPMAKAVVFAREDERASAFLVRSGAEGFSVTREEEKMGLNSSSTADLAFEGTPGERLGEAGGGMRVALRTLDGGRIGIAAQAVGIAQAAFELATGYAKERNAFGGPIARLGAIQSARRPSSCAGARRASASPARRRRWA